MSSQVSTTKSAFKVPHTRTRSSPRSPGSPGSPRSPDSPSSFSSRICNASGSSSSSSSSSSSGSYSLQPNDKNKISEAYDTWLKDETKLWHLKNSNTIVEVKMKEYALQCNFEQQVPFLFTSISTK